MVDNIKNREKVAKINDLHANLNTVPCKLMVDILNIAIIQARETNDHIAPDELRENQGAIRAYREMLAWMEKGIPLPQGITPTSTVSY